MTMIGLCRNSRAFFFQLDSNVKHTGLSSRFLSWVNAKGHIDCVTLGSKTCQRRCLKHLYGENGYVELAMALRAECLICLSIPFLHMAPLLEHNNTHITAPKKNEIPIQTVV